MRTFAGIALFAAGWLAFDASNASAAWNNVFQTCCASCGSHSSSSSFYSAPSTSFFGAPAASGCCPPPACPQICYKQRCYYCPYTAYRQQTVLEPVTTYQTSYYWAPVTTYRYTSFFDPCTCSCRQVCTPCTSYQLRSQCNAVCSYVQRCQMVPYTAYRQSCYLEPVVTYTQPACPPACPTSAAVAPLAAAPAIGQAAPPLAGSAQPPVPGIAEGSTPPPPVAGPAPDRQVMPGISEENRNIPPQGLPPAQQNRRVNPPAGGSAPTRIDRIAGNSNGHLQGTIVSDDRITPKGGAQLYFAASETAKPQFAAKADVAGRFNVELPPGEWAIFMTGANGKPVFHSQIVVKNNDQRLVTVVSR